MTTDKTERMALATKLRHQLGPSHYDESIQGPCYHTGNSLEETVREVISALESPDKDRMALAAELKQMAEKLNRYGYVLFAEKVSKQEKEWINNAFSEVAIRLNEIAEAQNPDAKAGAQA